MLLFQFELDQHLCLFARDEVLTWMQTKGKRYVTLDNVFRTHVSANIEGVVKKAELMACKLERAQVRICDWLSANLFLLC